MLSTRRWRSRVQVGPTTAQAVRSERRADALKHTHASRQRGLHSDGAIPFSWLQCLFSLSAYLWLLLNFVRTEFAIRDLRGFRTLEPDVLVSLGPYAYVGNVFTKASSSGNADGDVTNVSSSKPAALWSYKFDTTSIALRAFAEFANASMVPDCVLYRSKCTSDELAPATAFQMLDALVDAVQHKASELSLSQPRLGTVRDTAMTAQVRPRLLLLRASYEFFDRVHHYLLPQLFMNPQWRTLQAAYYSSDVLVAASDRAHSSASTTIVNVTSSSRNTSFVDFCSLTYGEERPFSCDEYWTSFRRACKQSKPKCRAVERVSLHVMQRLSELQTAYPNATVDLLVLEALRDVTIVRGGLTYVGKRGADIVTLMRVRTCSPASRSPETMACSTHLVDDYRYEMETCATDVVKWFPIVFFLRVVAQSYYWLRLAMLFGGCYAAAVTAEAAQPSNGPRSYFTLGTTRRALATFFKIPSQVIVYGSPFPIACYLLAHVIDSPMVYDLIGQQFDSLEGLFHLSLVDLVEFSSIQMRNVWILAALAHAAVRIATQRNWSPVDGVWGMPQFSIALISSLTIISQFRFITLRQTPVTSLQHIPVISRLHPALESLLFDGSGGGKSALGGVFLDLIAVSCSTVLIALVAGVFALAIRFVWPTSGVKLVFWRSYSVTPLSVGVLWSTNALAVSWSDDLVIVHRRVGTTHKRQAQSFRKQSSLRLMPSTVDQVVKHRVRAFGSLSPLQQQHQRQSSLLSQTQSVPRHPIELQTLDDRSEATEATMFLMNIAMLSEPITLLLLWRWNTTSVRLGYYRSTATNHVYLVPMAYVSEHSPLDWSGFTLERTVAVKDIAWTELITCG